MKPLGKTAHGRGLKWRILSHFPRAEISRLSAFRTKVPRGFRRVAREARARAGNGIAAAIQEPSGRYPDGKVTIRKDSPRFADWVRVFGREPVEVERAGTLDGKERLRVKLAALKVLQRQRCTRCIAEKAHLPVDFAARISPTVDADDVTVVEELFP